MKILTLTVLCLFWLFPQNNRAKDIEELKALRADFIKTTNEYKTSLEKLIAIYETNVKKAESRLDQSRKLRADDLLSGIEVERNEQLLIGEREKLAQAKKSLADADKQIAELPTDEQLLAVYKKSQAKQQPRRPKRCLNWDLVARRRETATSFSFSYTFVCR